MNVGILLFDDVQLTDFTGPLDVFLAASRVAQQPDAGPRFNIFTLASPSEVRCDGGLIVKIDNRLDDHPPIDLLVVPGGSGTRREENNPDLINWIRKAAEATMITASVCTGARLMAKTGLWDGLEVTTHWNSIEYLRNTFPALTVVEGVRYVDAGKFVSSAGITAGIDMALHLIERLRGMEHANLTARYLEYDYWEGYSRATEPASP
jgi:transcriptional regulator GlxA family with amidase domain